MKWEPIETAPRARAPMIVVYGVLESGYVTDPWCVWWQEGAWQRWPHKEPPTYWAELPELRRQRDDDPCYAITEAGRRMLHQDDGA